MDWSNTFLVQYFFLLTICLIMAVNSILRYKQHPRISTYSLLIVSCSLILAISTALEEYGKNIGNVAMATIFSYLGYTINPCCIYFFIMMSGEIKKRWYFKYSFIPLVLNALVFLLMFIPATKHLVVYYADQNGDGKLVFHGNYLRYCSHIISALYLLFLLYVSFTKISSKHITHGLTIAACSLFVIIAVVIESFFNDKGTIHILSTTIAISVMVYYLYLYIERTQIDTLTGLFNRETYYHDIAKMGKSVSGVIQFDMNGLKYLNDNYGHFEGDRALSTIADIITKSAKRNMYVYRLGGDEFVLVAMNATKEQLENVISKFKNEMSKTTYYCSIGCSYRSNKHQTTADLLKEAEKLMYEDKARFYENSPFERRKA